MYFDAHTHLNDNALFPTRQELLYQCKQASIGGVIIVGTEHQINERAIEIARTAPTIEPSVLVKATVGLHPALVSYGTITDTHTLTREMDALQRLLDQYPTDICALGECGIDAHYEGYTHHQELQQQLFYQQCRIALERSLPLVIHSRDHFADTLEIIQGFPGLKIYFHCRGYGPDELSVLEHLFPDLRIGFCGNITYPKASVIRDSATYLLTHPTSTARIVLETDAPYLSPQPKRGTTNTPLNLPDIYEYFLTQRSLSSDSFVASVEKNRRALYDLPNT